jgi:O-acetyl-ADP-ribose deacetylase
MRMRNLKERLNSSIGINKDKYFNFSDYIQMLICTVDVLKDNHDDEAVKRISRNKNLWEKIFFENLYDLLSIVHWGLKELRFGTLLIPFKREAEEAFKEFCLMAGEISRTHTFDECSELAKLAKKGDHGLLERMLEELKKIKLEELKKIMLEQVELKEKSISFEIASKLKKEGKQVFKHIREMTARSMNLKRDKKLIENEIEKLNVLKEEVAGLEKNYNKNIEIYEEVKSKLREKKNKVKACQHEFEYRGVTFKIRQENLVNEHTVAIVNPANSQLKHEGGAARAISDAAGEGFREDCEKYIKLHKQLLTGQAMVTRAGGKLGCDWVIHVVGPRYQNKADNSREEEQLKSALRSIMEIVKHENIASISIPAISTGIFKFPLGLCVKLMAQTIKIFIDR